MNSVFLIQIGRGRAQESAVIVANVDNIVPIQEAYNKAIIELGFGLDQEHGPDNSVAVYDLVLSDNVYDILLKKGFPFEKYGFIDRNVTRENYILLWCWFVCQGNKELTLKPLGDDVPELNYFKNDYFIFGYGFKSEEPVELDGGEMVIRPL